MNKYQEALYDIIDYGISTDYFNKEAEKPQEENRILIVQELVDKETPLKPYNIFNIKPNCRNCDAKLTTVENYCPNCGHRIDWSKNV